LEKRQLGKSSLQISEIGLGCMSLPTDLKAAEKILDVALDAGINYFDTADLYDRGRNEEVVGNALRQRRQDIILATKVGNRLNEDGEGWHWDASKKWIQSAVHQSLKRLQTDYIDVYQLHGGTMEDNVDEVIDAFESLKKEGLIREYGISSIRPTVIQRFLEKSNAVSVMMQYSLLDRRPEEWLYLLEHKGASLLTRGSLAKGLLTEEGLARASKMGQYLTYSEEQLQKTIKELKELGVPLNALAIQYILQQHVTGSVIAGASSPEQLQDTIAGYEQSVSPEVLQKAAEITKQDIYEEHRLD